MCVCVYQFCVFDQNMVSGRQRLMLVNLVAHNTWCHRDAPRVMDYVKTKSLVSKLEKAVDGLRQKKSSTISIK